jgi:hypothetical protein
MSDVQPKARKAAWLLLVLAAAGVAFLLWRRSSAAREAAPVVVAPRAEAIPSTSERTQPPAVAEPPIRPAQNGDGFLPREAVREPSRKQGVPEHRTVPHPPEDPLTHRPPEQNQDGVNGARPPRPVPGLPPR